MKIKNEFCICWRNIKGGWILWVLFLLCVYIIFAYHIDAIKMGSLFDEETTQDINDVALTLAYGCFTGFIVYIFTVFWPHVRKSRAILFNVAEDLRYLKDEMYELSQTLCQNDWLKRDKVSVDKIIEGIVDPNAGSSCLSDKPLQISKINTNFMKEKIRLFDGYLSSIMSYEAYLSFREIKEVTQIRNSHSFRHINHHFKIDEVTNDDRENLLRLINDMIDNNQKIVDLYENLKVYRDSFSKCPLCGKFNFNS